MSSSSSVSSSRRSGNGQENNENPPLAGMDLRFQQLEQQVIATTTTTSTTTQLRVSSIIDIVGCDITIDDIQFVKQELIDNEVDLKMNVNENQKFPAPWNGDTTYMWTPLMHFCWTGNLLVVKVLFLIGADCTNSCISNWFPMLAAAQQGHLDICQWLFDYGGDAKYQINKETKNSGSTPLSNSYNEWHYGRDKEGKTCRWLLQNGGGQHLSSNAMREFVSTNNTNSNLLVLWMRENMQLHDTFILFLCGVATTTTMIATSTSSSEAHQERSLQILDGQPGVMELIGEYVGLLRGKEFRMLEEFNELVIAYNNTDESSSDGSDDNAEDGERRWWWYCEWWR